ncbi:MAG: alginate export family protein [Novosphingobium sp.]
MLRAALVTASLGLALPAHAQEPARTNLRYDEDWSAQPPGPKNLRLDSQGHFRLTVGVELRARQESYADPMWGDAADDGYLWLRAMPFADLHAGPVRAFVQPIFAIARGVGGGNGPADQTGLDLVQGFVEARLLSSGRDDLTFRAGRALVALGSERLVGLRYGPNVPQPFDGLRLAWKHGAFKADLLDLGAVETKPGNFNDRGTKRRQLRAVYATVATRQAGSFDLYWISFRNRSARFGGLIGDERRETFGLRMSGGKPLGRSARIGWNWETMVQRGRFAGLPIKAWSQATETSLAFPNAALSPRVRLRANYASGNAEASDDKIGTFDALFPKGRYFGELTPVGPRNIVNLHPSIDIAPSASVNVELSVAAFWRASTGDGIYDVPGQLIRPAGNSRDRHIGNQIEMGVSWQATQTIAISGSIARFGSGRFLRQTGSADPIYMAGLEAAYKF